MVLLAASGSGDADTMKMMLDFGIDICCENEQGQNAAHIACANNQPSSIECLDV